jgi:hypothetical protein
MEITLEQAILSRLGDLPKTRKRILARNDCRGPEYIEQEYFAKQVIALWYIAF